MRSAEKLIDHGQRETATCLACKQENQAELIFNTGTLHHLRTVDASDMCRNVDEMFYFLGGQQELRELHTGHAVRALHMPRP